MPEVKIYRGRSKLYANFIQKFSKLSYYIFAGGDNFSKIILDMVDFQKKKRILDIGCGVGNLLIDINQRLGDQNNKPLVVGGDYSKEMIRIAMKKFKNHNKPSFVICDACRLPFKNNTFDACFNVLLLHHLPLSLKKQALSEAARVLSLNGTCILMDIDKPEDIRGWAIALSRWHIQTIRENFIYGLNYLFLSAGFKLKARVKKMGLFSYCLLEKT